METKQHVYFFEEGSGSMKDLLGGKGAGLAEMTKTGLPVPPGMTVTTETCIEYYQNGKEMPTGLEAEITEKLGRLEIVTGKRFGDADNPLLVSVRSGAKFSMPGMMDTILNLGLNDHTVKGLATKTGNERFAADCYRRFIQMFSQVVLGIEHDKFEDILEGMKHRCGAKLDTELDAAALNEMIGLYKDLVVKETGSDFPQNTLQQLMMSVHAVFASWNNQRAITYRKINKIPDDLGTAVNIQTMVFGNIGGDSGTGVAFTRNPSTGERVVFGEYLVNAQGEDVVAGLRTPSPIVQLEQDMPEVYRQFMEVCQLLEMHYRDMQDIEFTIENRKLYMLQTRNGKRTAAAAAKIAVDMVAERLITKEEALLRLEPEQISQILHRRIDPAAKYNVLSKGLPASPGAACGRVVFDADTAEIRAREEKVLLVRPETTPDDIHGMVAAQGILTSRGGMTSHAAVVARGMGKPCVCGCEALKFNLEEKQCFVGEVIIREGDYLTIDGAKGEIIVGQVPTIEPMLTQEVLKVLAWADEIRVLGVRANADTPEDARVAREFGAQGIGLCRTEHMFMAQDRLPIVQQMIMAETTEERENALDKLLPMQQSDFEGILEAMEGLPVTIRLLDPPLHEFLPNAEELAVEIAELRLTGKNPELLARKEEMLRKVRTLAEFNPMLGLRGCRLGIVHPAIYEMQARAIFQAVATLIKKGVKVMPEVMIPLVGHPSELALMKDMVHRIAKVVMEQQNSTFSYLVGTMIELPRACIVADSIAEHAQFFSFGTNDLTQTAFGFSRDDAEGKFLQHYLDKKLLKENPFAVLDREGVGELINMAVKKGRGVRTDLKVGICGEHGGDPSSIEFCHLAGMNYVSCSPYRVPIARLAAAQAFLKNKQ